jgi:hypothetical protein
MLWLGEKLSAWQVTTAYPIAMQIALSGLEEKEREQTARLIYSYIVRRAVCDLRNKNFNKLFQGIAQRFFEAGPSYATMKDFFHSRHGDSSRFPTDQEFKTAIETNPVYHLAQGERNKDILWEFELASRTRFAESVERPIGLWTEHVLPVSWTTEWPFPDGSTLDHWSQDLKVAERRRLLDSLGNLTLVTDSFNISLGNKAFVDKRERYSLHTTLFLNKWFLKKEKWNEDDIQQRGIALAELAVSIWPGIEGNE